MISRGDFKAISNDVVPSPSTTDVYMEPVTHSPHVVRIEDIDEYLASHKDDDDDDDVGEDAEKHVVLSTDQEGNKLMDAKMNNGSSIPMEKRSGEKKLRIPRFVLGSQPVES